MEDNIIKEGDKVILKKGISMATVQIRRNKRYYIEKMDFLLEGAIGHPYGCEFETKGIRICPVQADCEDGDVGAGEAGRDNRNILDDSASQKLSREEIEEMRKKGETGENVVKQLIENSATFKTKTEFSQQKYIKKKNKKHLNRFRILRPSTRLIAEMYFNKGPARINNLRIDSLCQMLTQGDIRADTRQLVVENCNGLLVAAVVERMGGFGTIVQLHSGQHPPRQAMEGYPFTKEHSRMLHSFPLQLLNTVYSTDTSQDTLQQPTTLTETAQDGETVPSKKARLDTTAASESSDTLSATVTDPADNTEAMNEEDKEGATTGTTETSQQDTSSKKACLDTTGASESSDTLSANVTDPADNTEAINGEDKEGATTGTTETSQQDTSSKATTALDSSKMDQDERKLTRLRQIEDTRRILQERNFDGLLVATKDHPTPIVLGLINLVKDSRPVVVFSPHNEPLLDLYMKLRDRSTIAMLKLSETWLRNYQVLPNRTHPEVMMSNTSGYLLSFIKTNCDLPQPSTA